jgi:hypothetical protein
MWVTREHLLRRDASRNRRRDRLRRADHALSGHVADRVREVLQRGGLIGRRAADGTHGGPPPAGDCGPEQPRGGRAPVRPLLAAALVLAGRPDHDGRAERGTRSEPRRAPGSASEGAPGLAHQRGPPPRNCCRRATADRAPHSVGPPDVDTARDRAARLERAAVPSEPAACAPALCGARAVKVQNRRRRRLECRHGQPLRGVAGYRAPVDLLTSPPGRRAGDARMIHDTAIYRLYILLRYL